MYERPYKIAAVVNQNQLTLANSYSPTIIILIIIFAKNRQNIDIIVLPGTKYI